MDLLNADGTDFSNEIVLQIALMLEMINAAHLIAYRLDRILGNANLKSNLIRDRKLALSEAQKAARRVVTQFNAAFDGVFDKAAKAQEIADSYAPPFRKVAYNACMEAFAEAVKIDREGVITDKTLPSPRTPVLR